MLNNLSNQSLIITYLSLCNGDGNFRKQSSVLTNVYLPSFRRPFLLIIFCIRLQCRHTAFVDLLSCLPISSHVSLSGRVWGLQVPNWSGCAAFRVFGCIVSADIKESTFPSWRCSEFFRMLPCVVSVNLKSLSLCGPLQVDEAWHATCERED